MKHTHLLISVFLMILVSNNCFAGDFEDGEEAFEKKDYSNAVKLYSKVCDNGDVRGCYGLAQMYRIGQGVEENNATALKLYTQACEGGFSAGCISVEDEYLAKACANGNAFTCSQLGDRYTYEGKDRNYSKAIKLYTKACDNGDASGCVGLAGIYKEGKGVKQDYAKAVELYTQARDSKSVVIKGGGLSGQQIAEMELYSMSHNGQAVNKKKAKVVESYTKSYAKNNVKQEIISRCKSQMGTYGSSLVKACVDQDIKAIVALNKYPSKYNPTIDRCMGQMRDYGYSLVKACVDQDIEAEKALSHY